MMILMRTSTQRNDILLPDILRYLLSGLYYFFEGDKPGRVKETEEEEEFYASLSFSCYMFVYRPWPNNIT